MIRRFTPGRWLARQMYTGKRRAGTPRPPQMWPPFDPWRHNADTVVLLRIGGQGDG